MFHVYLLFVEENGGIRVKCQQPALCVNVNGIYLLCISDNIIDNTNIVQMLLGSQRTNHPFQVCYFLHN